jgi:hypothetical protein
MDRPEPDTDLEISDLPGTRNYRISRTSPFVRALARQPRLRSRLWQAATAGSVLVLLLIVLSGSFPQLEQGFLKLFMRPSPALRERHSDFEALEITTQYQQRKVLAWYASTPPVVPLTSGLEAVPQYCLQYTLTQAFDSPPFPPGVGGAPMWVTGFSGPAGQHAVLDRLSRALLPQSGWYQRMQLVSATNYPGTITLQGGAEGSNLPLWFSAYPRGTGLIRSITVNPLDSGISNHTTGDQQWGVSSIDLYIARAGCYYLTATWAGGSWTAYFAAGR